GVSGSDRLRGRGGAIDLCGHQRNHESDHRAPNGPRPAGVTLRHRRRGVILLAMGSMKARVAERGQVTIPKRLRERLGMKPGTLLEFSEERGRLVAVKSDVDDPVSRAIGSLGKGIDTDAVMAELRGRR